MNKLHLHLKNFPTEMALRLTLVNFCVHFLLMTLKNMICTYLFYRFSDYVKACGSHRRKIGYKRKYKDSVGMQKVEERSKQFLAEKIIHGVEFKNPYNTEVEKNPEIIETVEHNYRIARRVYQQLWMDNSKLFAEFIRSVNPLDLQDMDEDIKNNG